VRVVDVEKNRLPSDTADTPITRTVFLAALCIQSFPFALLKVLILGTTQWGKRIKKNPGNNKNNADRQRFQGGFVKTGPPFDFPGCRKTIPSLRASMTTLFTGVSVKHVQFLRKPLKSPFLRFANTEFHA
jgi:hypothetical protein